ncbi:STAS domain-containing protein [Nocardia tengchongensis]
MTTSVQVTAGNVHICTVRGEIDLQTAPAFRKVLLDNIDGESVVLDLRAVTFLGISGVRALLAAQRVARRRHCKIVIDGSYCVTRVLDVLDLSGGFGLRSVRDRGAWPCSGSPPRHGHGESAITVPDPDKRGLLTTDHV